MTHPHHSQQESQQQWDDAIDNIINLISKQDNVTTVEQAIQTLIATGGQYASSTVHAMYLQRVPNDHFTRKEVSIFLADYQDDNDNDELLDTYFKLVHFGGLSITESLRKYFTDLNLIALNNKTQLNVLLTGLASAFQTNGGLFSGDIEDCVRVYNAMIMLNESLHSKNHLGRMRMTETSFIEIINDRKANQIKNFDESEMRRIYNSISKSSLMEKQSSTSLLIHTVDVEQNDNVKKPLKSSHSKYGKSKGGSDIIIGQTNNIQNDDDTPSNSGTCCVIL